LLPNKQASVQFGTDGIRGRVGSGFFVQDNLIRFGKAFAAWLSMRTASRVPRVLLVCDTRASCPWVKSCIAAGILPYKIELYDGGILPTPAALVAMLSADITFDAALIISASHNPYFDNGIKIMLNSGKLSADDEALLVCCFEGGEKYRQEALFSGTFDYFTQAKDLYKKFILNVFPPHLLEGLTIVLDCAHGSAGETAPAIFQDLGARVIAINNSPNGTNINEQCGSVQPESLKRAVLDQGADIGFAFDGDGDRVIAVSRDGQIKDGDDSLALLIHHPAYQNADIVVGTTMTNLGCEHYLVKHGKRLIRTGVGDKFVSETLANNKLPLGGEQVGHTVLRDILPVGDGTIAALRMLETIRQTDNMSMQTFTRYPQVFYNLPVQQRRDLTIDPYASILQEAQGMVENGRIVVRYSGTEPVLRVMAEAESEEIARKAVDFVATAFRGLP